MADKDKIFYVDDIPYNREATERLREDLIILRNGAIKQDNLQWAVSLSHAIALWNSMIIEIWGEK